MLKGTVWMSEPEKNCSGCRRCGVSAACYDRLFGCRPAGGRTGFPYIPAGPGRRLGFVWLYSQREKDLFLQLIGISGIGPKAALSILAAYPVKQIKAAIIQEDVSLLTQVSGIGAKTAKRIILELREKLKEALESTGGSAEDEAFDAAASSAAKRWIPCWL
jgi:Holliday junction DNA helicase RuvA